MTLSAPRIAFVACLLGLSGAQAQDRVDRELDDSLRRTYEGEPSRSEPVPDYAEGEIEKEADQFQVTLRLTGALQAAVLEDLDIVYREGSSGGSVIPLMTRSDRDWDVDGSLAAIPTIELNLGGIIALRGSATGVSWRDDENQVDAGQAFTFGRTTFATGDRVESQFDLFTGDMQLGAHVVTNRYVRLGLYGGARYVAWETTLERSAGGAYVKERSKVESLVPTFTLTLDVSPTPWLELYVNGTAGWFGYESADEVVVSVNGNPQRIPERRRETTTLDAEGGLRLIFGGHFGIYAGYRIAYLEIDREVLERREGVKGLAHGPVAGLLIQF